MLLRSGELARLAGVSVDTLRHYEHIGVLPAPRRTESNYRLYSPEAVDRVRLVRQALSIGFSLTELAKILRVREKGGFPCRQVKALLDNKLIEVDREIANLQALRAHLRMLLKDWRKRLDQTPQDQPARLLETLPQQAQKGNLSEKFDSSRLSRGRNGIQRAAQRS